MERALSVAPSPSSLDDPKVRAVLERLHAAARGDTFRMLGRLPTLLPQLLGRTDGDAAKLSAKLKELSAK